MTTRQHLVFRIGDARVSIPAAAVDEVAAFPQRLTRVPDGPENVLGVTFFRGEVTPVISAAGLLSRPAQAPPQRMIVLRQHPVVALAIDAFDGLEIADQDLHPGRLLITDDVGEHIFDLETALSSQAGGLRARERSAIPVASAVSPSEVPNLAFLSVTLGGQIYAFPLEAVREVGSADGAAVALPRTDPALAGLQAWRDQTLPVISLRVLLGLAADGTERRRVVIDLLGRPIALLVDEVSGIIRLRADRLSPAPPLFNRGGGEAQVRNVLRLMGGQRLVAVLRPEDLLADERLETWLSHGAPASAGTNPAHEETATAHLIVEIAGEAYAMPLAAVHEVIGPLRLSHAPGGPAALLGVTSLRGHILPVLDLADLLGTGLRSSCQRIVVAWAQGAYTGLAVDRAAEVIRLSRGDIAAAPELDVTAAGVFPHAALVQERLVLVIDPERLVSRTLAASLDDLRREAAT